MDEFINTIFQTCEAILADLLAFVVPVDWPLFMDELINSIFQTCEAILADLLAFAPPVDSPLFTSLLGGLLATALLLFVWLMIQMRKHRLNNSASKVLGREITFEDVSAEAADGANAQVHASGASAENVSAAKDAALAGDESASGPATVNAEARPTGFTFFKRKPKSVDSAAVSGNSNAAPNAGDAGAGDDVGAGDGAVLAGLEQEMLATRQLYLDGMISKEVYVTETRALYQKAQGRMT